MLFLNVAGPSASAAAVTGGGPAGDAGPLGGVDFAGVLARLAADPADSPGEMAKVLPGKRVAGPSVIVTMAAAIDGLMPGVADVHPGDPLGADQTGKPAASATEVAEAASADATPAVPVALDMAGLISLVSSPGLAQLSPSATPPSGAATAEPTSDRRGSHGGAAPTPSAVVSAADIRAMIAAAQIDSASAALDAPAGESAGPDVAMFGIGRLDPTAVHPQPDGRGSAAAGESAQQAAARAVAPMALSSMASPGSAGGEAATGDAGGGGDPGSGSPANENAPRQLASYEATAIHVGATMSLLHATPPIVGGEVAVVPPTVIDAADLAPQIVQALKMQWHGGIGEARIRLQPEYLGELSITIRVERGVVTASLTSDTPAVREWLQGHESLLRQGLAGHGLQLDRLVVLAGAPRAEPENNSESRQQPQEPPSQEPSPRQREQSSARRRPGQQTFEVVL
jgi:flagellar hook-length control protein FliK